MSTLGAVHLNGSRGVRFTFLYIPSPDESTASIWKAVF